jgi:hypothetical protein
MSTEWFYRIDEQEHGPVAGKTLKLLAEVGQITPNTLVRKSTSKSWNEAHHVKQLFDAHNSQPKIAAPPIIGQSADSQHAKTSPVQPPPQIRAVAESPTIIPTAELATESEVFAPQINIVTATHFEGSAKNNSPNSSNAAGGNAKNRRLLFVGILLTLCIGSFLFMFFLMDGTFSNNTNRSVWKRTKAEHDTYKKIVRELPSLEEDRRTNSVNATESLPPDHSLLINNVFSKQAQWIDPTNGQFLPTRDALLSITHVWLDTQQTEQPILNIVIKIENRDKSIELPLQRQFANQNADRTHELSPYVPLIRLTTGDGQLLDSDAKLVNRTIPVSSEISETYQIALTVKQSAELGQFRVAVPKAWINKSGYWGFEIPQVMITTSKPTESPVQIASEPNPSGNLVDTQSGVVGGEENVDDGKGVLPPPFPSKTTKAKTKNGDQPTTIQDLQSQIGLEKKRVPEPRGDEPQ